MTSSAQRHAAAQEQATRHLARTRERHQLQVQPVEGGPYYRAKLHVPHPDDEARVMCAAACGPGRDQAIELVRLELRGQLVRHFLDEGVGSRSQRDQLVYDHGTLIGATRVAQAVVDRGGEPPGEREVGLAYIAMRAVGDVTVGDVADALLRRRQGLEAAGPTVGEQARLM